MTFLLNCLVSVLTGTAFGTGATMGVICATMAASLGLDVRLVGGAILAGVYFGDRCSPVSTSALLVAELTRTSIYSNIHRMVRTALVPFLGSCGIYLVLGFTQNAGGDLPDLRTLFARVFVLHWAALAPAVVILVLSVLQINVKIAMSASILTALPLCLFLQHVPVPDLLKMVFTGYQTPDAQVGVMMNGGGIFSMVRVAGIVCLSSAYSGIFQKTGLLDGLKRGIETVSRKTNVFAATFLTGTAASMLACNQSLGILLTNQLCRDLEQDRDRFANILEDTVVVVAPLVPWSIAGAVPLASAGAPTSSIPFAVYLWLLPLWGLLRSFLQSNPHRAGSGNTQDQQRRQAVG